MPNLKTSRWRLLSIKTLLLTVAALLLFGLFKWRYHYQGHQPRLDLHGLVEQRCAVEKVVLDVDLIIFSNEQGLFKLSDTSLIEPLVSEMRLSTYTGPTKCLFEKIYIL